ncbi:MAG TPA: FtsQ-type POTRA domain-containing protein, partial [Acidimicrobiales bacterium]|nr:FtsQ-type POTRA domain-containing protein [Acidimicrobiales bacterium]
PLLRVRQVTIIGNVHTPRAELLAAAGLSSGATLMIETGSGAERRAVQALPWVGTADFARHWPWTLVITVHERAPAALVPGSPGATDVVDQTGRVLEVLARGERGPALAVLQGVRGALPGQRVSPAEPSTDLAALLAAAASTPPALARDGLSLGAGPGGQLVAYYGPGKVVVLLGSPSQVAYKLAVLGELAQRVQLLGYSQADLRVPERPALSPVPSAGNS